MTQKFRWGILGVAELVRRRIIPAMPHLRDSEIVAIASRDTNKAEAAAKAAGIARSYGSYDELIADSDIDGVYIPLPNHLHYPWTVRAAERGKHVLCEKPLAMGVAEARALLAVRERTNVKIGEAMTLATHPRFLRCRELIQSGRIGEVKSVMSWFGFRNLNPADIRNRPELGGGALLDLGCYPIAAARFMFDAEPLKLIASVVHNEEFNVDHFDSAILEFPSGQAVLTCAMGAMTGQGLLVGGTTGRFELPEPFSPPQHEPSRILINDESNLFDAPIGEEVASCDPFAIELDMFAQSARNLRDVPVPLEESIKNLAVIEAIFRSGGSGRWEVP